MSMEILSHHSVSSLITPSSIRGKSEINCALIFFYAPLTLFMKLNMIEKILNQCYKLALPRFLVYIILKTFSYQ